MHIELTPGALYMGWEITCLGRSASEEKYHLGKLRQVTELWLEGNLLWSERAIFRGGDALLDSPIGLAGQSVTATFLAAGKDVENDLLSRCRELQVNESVGDRRGITTLPNLLIARYLGTSTERARHYFATLWTLLRPFFAERTACPPRIWRT